MRFDPDTYETVDERLIKFHEDHPDGRIVSLLLSDPNKLDEVVFQAEVYFSSEEEKPRATGHASEKRGGQGANLTAHVENCETSAIGRALVNCGYKARKEAPRPSRQEMEKLNRSSYTRASEQEAREAASREDEEEETAAAPPRFSLAQARNCYIDKAKEAGITELSEQKALAIYLHDGKTVPQDVDGWFKVAYTSIEDLRKAVEHIRKEKAEATA